MRDYRSKLLLLSLASIGCIVTAAFGLDWFVMTFGEEPTLIDMRSIRSCTPSCSEVDLHTIGGPYPVLVTIAFWCSLALVLVLVTQCCGRLISARPQVSLSRIGYVLAAMLFCATFWGGYVFSPAATTETGAGLDIVRRTWAPFVMLVGAVVSVFACRHALHAPDDALV
jgi:hypothetical protein